MQAIELLRSAMNVAHQSHEATVADVTPEMAHWRPPGQAHPIGSLYAHMVVGEDTLVNAVLQGGAPLYAGPWAGRTGLAQPSAAFSRTVEQAREMRVDLPKVRAYAQAVYAASDAFLASLDDAALDRVVDFTQFDMGTMTLGDALANLVLGHVRDIMGEISALKGVQGAKGYPF